MGGMAGVAAMAIAMVTSGGLIAAAGMLEFAPAGAVMSELVLTEVARGRRFAPVAVAADNLSDGVAAAAVVGNPSAVVVAVAVVAVVVTTAKRSHRFSSSA